MNEWQPIEHPPEDGVDVILIVDARRVHGWRDAGRWYLGCEGIVATNAPTAWMHFPEPPR